MVRWFDIVSIQSDYVVVRDHTISLTFLSCSTSNRLYSREKAGTELIERSYDDDCDHTDLWVSWAGKGATTSIWSQESTFHLLSTSLLIFPPFCFLFNLTAPNNASFLWLVKGERSSGVKDIKTSLLNRISLLTSEHLSQHPIALSLLRNAMEACSG